jgi:hypothetical protein
MISPDYYRKDVEDAKKNGITFATSPFPILQRRVGGALGVAPSRLI